MENASKIDQAVLANLKKLKEESTAGGSLIENTDLVTIEDNPDDLVKEIPKFRAKDEEFDYSVKRSFFDEVYFRDSKLLKM
jgi:hypothetical protein